MPQTHVPVLAGELIEALDPQPGQIAVDCTLGGGGHARLVAERLGPTGTLIAIDRDPTAEAAFAELAAEVACETRFLRADFATGLAAARRRGPARGPRLHGPRHELDAGRHARARLLLRLRRAAGHADGPRPGADRARDRQHLGPPPDRPRAARVRRGALRRPDRGRDRPPPPELTTTFELNDAITAAIPAPARFAGGHPAKRTFQAIRIAVNGELQQLDEALPLAWERPARSAAASRRSRSTRSRTGASSASSPTAPAAASARPTSRSAAAAARRRPSSSTAARSSPRRARSRPTPARSRPACGPPASSGRSANAQARHRDTSPHRAARTRAASPARTPQAGPGGAARPRPHRRLRAPRALPDHRVVDRLLRGRAVHLGDRHHARRDRGHAGLAAAAELRHLARGRRRRARSSARTRPAGADRRASAPATAIRAAALKDDMIDPPAGDTRFLTRAARDRRRLRALKRMKPPSDAARAVMANGGFAARRAAPRRGHGGAAPAAADAGGGRDATRRRRSRRRGRAGRRPPLPTAGRHRRRHARRPSPTVRRRPGTVAAPAGLGACS